MGHHTIFIQTGLKMWQENMEWHHKELLDKSQQYQCFVYAWEDVFLWKNGIVSYICLLFGIIIFINDVFR